MQPETQYYRTVPVSEKPKQLDRHYILTDEHGIEGDSSWYGQGGWHKWLGKPPSRFTHYLQPIPLPDAERLREALEKMCKKAQELFDEKKNNPHNKKSGLQFAWNNLASALWDANKALSAVGDGWIRCEEKQPELNEVIWLGWSGAHVTPGRLVEGKPWLQEEPIYISNENGHAFVPQPTHWKPYIVPLPPPPINK